MKIDITQLEGYTPEMTPEEKLALVEQYEIPDQDADAKKWKAQFDKTASDLAAAHKELKAKRTEAEQKEAERLAVQLEQENELKLLRREKALNGHKASFLALGWDEKLSAESAEALVDNDFEKVFANMGKAKAVLEKAFKAEALANMQHPPAGHDPDKDSEEKRQLAAIRRSMGLPT